MATIGGCFFFLIVIAFLAVLWAIWRYTNLIALVKGEMQFEQDTLEKVIAARNSAVAARGVADAAEKENALTQTLSRLFALAENYPNLKANESVKALMEELSSTENKIGFARQFYNDIATRFNIAQQVFPDSLIA